MQNITITQMKRDPLSKRLEFEAFTQEFKEATTYFKNLSMLYTAVPLTRRKKIATWKIIVICTVEQLTMMMLKWSQYETA